MRANMQSWVTCLSYSFYVSCYHLIFILMAVVKYTSIVAELKGSIGGTTFQKCGQSLSVRSNPYHKKAFTESAMISRNQVLYVASLWRGLSVSQKAGWAAAASTFPTKDKWGNPVVLSGYQLFMYVNRPFLMADVQMLSDAVIYTPFTLFGATLSDLDLTAETISPSFSGTPDDDYVFIIYVSNFYSGNLYKPYLPKFFVYRYPIIYGSGVSFYNDFMAAIKFQPVVGQLFSWEIWSACMSTGTMLLENVGSSSVVS